MILEAHEVRVELPPGWSGRLFAHAPAVATLHIANYALPPRDGEFGDLSTATMPSGGSFAALTEYLPGPGLRAGSGLFAPRGMSLPLDPTSFGRERLAHARPGQVGMQHFFTAVGRPFCLYVVLAGPRGSRHRQLHLLSHVLASTRISAHR